MSYCNFVSAHEEPM